MSARPRRGSRLRAARAVRLAATCVLGAGLALTLTTVPPAADRAVAATPTPSPTARPSPSPATDDSPALQVQVEVTSVAPQVVRPGEDLVVRATLRNTGADEVTDPRVAVRISRFLISTRSALTEWEEADPTGSAGTTVQSSTLGAPLVAGAETVVEILVPAGALRLSTAATSWGPRGIAVEVTDGGARRGLERTFALWYPTEDVTPTRVSVAVPLTGDAVDPTLPDRATPLSTAALSRLDALVDLTEDHAEVGWVVDPALLAALAADGADPTEAGSDSTGTPDSGTAGSGATDPGATAQALAGRVVRAAAGRDVFALGWLDPDLGALAHASSTTLFATATDLAAAGPLPLLDIPPRTDLAWPANPVPDQATADLAASTGTRALVVGDDALEAKDLNYTPTGRATVPTPNGALAALVADPVLTGLLVDPPQPTPATAAQRVLAETAVIAHERPSVPRHLLLAPGRDFEPDVATASAQLAALAAAPWVTPTSVSTLIGAADPGVDRTSLPAVAVAAAELPRSSVEALTAARAELATFATIAADPVTLVGDADADLLAPLSVAWRGSPPGRDRVVGHVLEALAASTGAVSIVPGSGLLIISQSGTFSVGLANALDQAVTVQVLLEPENRALVIDEIETVLIPAGGEAQTRVPFHAVGSGDVRVAATLLTPGGAAISAPTRLTVRVRADWENVGTGVLAGVLGVAFVFGIVRTIRRGQTTRRGASEAEIAQIADPRELGP